MLEKYIKAFSNLRTDKNRNSYPAITDHRAPHKPFLLISIMDLIAQGQITRNFIAPSYELVETWNTYYFILLSKGTFVPNVLKILLGHSVCLRLLSPRNTSCNAQATWS